MPQITAVLDAERALWSAEHQPPASPPQRQQARPGLRRTLPILDTLHTAKIAPAKSAVTDFITQTKEVVHPTHQGTERFSANLPPTPELFAPRPGVELETRLADLEEVTRRKMGTVGLRGYEWGMRIGFGIGSVVSFALAFVPGAQLPLPALASIILVSATLVGAAIGGIAQAVARARFHRANPGVAEATLAQLLQMQRELLALPSADFKGTQLRQLRRIELLQKDIEGGFVHAAWQLVFAITNVDPKLRTMFKTYLPHENPNGPHAPPVARWYRPTWASKQA